MRWLDRFATIDTPGQALAYVAGAGLLGFGLAVGGNFPAAPVTILAFTAALIVILVGLTGPSWIAGVNPRIQRITELAAVMLQLGLLIVIRPELFVAPTPDLETTPYVAATVFATFIGFATIAMGRQWSVAGLALLTVVHVGMGVWVILAPADPISDVWVFQQIGADELLQGHNPYAITRYPDIYGPGSPFYAPGLVEGGFLTFGFPYPPLSLLMALPGWALFGDHRFAQLLAMAGATWLIATARPDRFALVPAVLFLFTARTFLVLERGWTDPFVVLLLATTVWLAARGSSATVLALGLTVAVKQHLLVALPLGALLLRWGWRPRWTIAWQAATTAAVISLPFVLWDVAAFVRSTIVLHLEQPFRADSMSYVAWLGQGGQPGLPVWTGFAMLVPVTALVVLRAARTPAGFAAAVAVVLLIFFLFSKQAFVHYHYLVIGCLCVAAAAIRPGSGRLVHDEFTDAG